MTTSRSNSSSTPPQEEILTQDDVATWLKIERREVVRLGIPILRLGHKTLRFMRGDVLAWLKQHASNPTPTQGEL